MLSEIFLKKLLSKIIQIRTFEELIAEDYKKNNIKSFLHLTIGQEGTAVGVASALKKNDYFFGNHRSHGHYLAKGGDWKKMIYEIYGDKRGCCKGYGGSMHMLDRKVGFQGSTPILGSAVPIAAGIAAAKKFKKKKELSVVFVGDGAAEEGAFYETINLAGLYKLPLLIIIEDNLYSVETSHQERKSKYYNFKNLFRNGFGAIYECVDGQDAVKVYELSLKMKKDIIKQNNVGIIHSFVRRKFAHSGVTIDLDSKYRKNDGVAVHELKDPINILSKYLEKKNLNRSDINSFILRKRNYFSSQFFKIRRTIKLNLN
jgi:TPP-dependent pyruvate/acetoin dehydrogenase alpha subunit